MGLFDKIKESNELKKKQREEFEKNNTVAFMCHHLKNKNIKLCNANYDSRRIIMCTCEECGKNLNYNNVMLVSLADIINLHNEEMKDFDSIKDESVDWELTEEMEDNIINTNINRNNDLRSDITGIKINVERRFE